MITSIVRRDDGEGFRLHAVDPAASDAAGRMLSGLSPLRHPATSDRLSDKKSSGWSEYPDRTREENPGKSYVGDDGEVLDPDPENRVVALGALCGLRGHDADDDGQSHSFWVSEFARIANGRRIILHEARGFTMGGPFGPMAAAEGPVATREDLVEVVLAVVLPDPEDGEEHPWAWLALLARNRGLNVTAEDLRSLPYEVVLTDGVTRWLDAS